MFLWHINPCRLFNAKSYIYTYIYMLKCVYFGNKLLFKQVLLKTMEHCLLFSILFFHLDPDTRKIARSLEKIKLKMINCVPSSLTKTCLNIYIYIYVCVCVCVCVYLCMCVCACVYIYIHIWLYIEINSSNLDYSVFLLPSYCRIQIHVYFHTILLEIQIPNTFLHDI